MLNHRRPSNRLKDETDSEYDEQIALLSSQSSTDTRQTVYNYEKPSDSRNAPRKDYSGHASTALPMDNLVFPTRNGLTTSYLTSKFSHLNDTSPSSSINFSESISTGGSRQNFVYYTVQPGDTLQNLSVKYSSSVASIKRINNLWSDQEFHALAKIKLPVGKFNLLSNVIEEEETYKTPNQTSSNASHSNNYSNPSHNQQQFIVESRLSGDLIPVSDHQADLAHLPPEDDTTGSPDSVFKKLDLNIEKARSAAKHYDNHADEILQSLADGGNIVQEDNLEDQAILIARQQAETLLNDMTEFGMTYTGLILFIFIVCLIFPLAYVIYLEETHHAARHETNKVD